MRCITAVLTPHIRSIELTLQDPNLVNDVELYGEQLAMSLSAIAQLSKGWQSNPPIEVQTVLAAAVDICQSVLNALSASPIVRNRTAVLLQRMILCLGAGILPAMPSFFELLLSRCTLLEDVLDISQLMNQLSHKFKEKAGPVIDLSIVPFLHRVLAIQLTNTRGSDCSVDDSPPPHLMIEQLSIRKHAFSTLQHITTNNMSAVLYSDKNISSLGDIFKLMNDGAVTVPDPTMSKTCIHFFC